MTVEALSICFELFGRYSAGHAHNTSVDLVDNGTAVRASLRKSRHMDQVQTNVETRGVHHNGPALGFLDINSRVKIDDLKIARLLVGFIPSRLRALAAAEYAVFQHLQPGHGKRIFHGALAQESDENG